jgi:hypothetical protein
MLVRRGCGGFSPLREEDPRGRPRALEGGRANESVARGRVELEDISSFGVDSRSLDSSGSSGGGVLPDAEAIFNGLSAICVELLVEAGGS